jgi:alcohol dehydrogenase class IV
MTSGFEFATAARIIFGPGTLAAAAPAAAEIGKRALLVTGSSEERSHVLAAGLAERQVTWSRVAIAGEPSVAMVAQGVQTAARERVDLVIGLGGGSALDAAKAIAVLSTNPGDPLDYLEVIGRGMPLKQAGLPCILIPTTAGTGTEVTRNAVLASPEHGVKVSLRGPQLLARLAIVDPELTYSQPPEVTAWAGLDALTQLIEPYTTQRAQPMTDAICLEGIRRVARSLRLVYKDGEDRAAREDMSLASLFSGLALANSGLGAVHGFASVLGGRYDGHHGAVCAALLPVTMEVNIRALRQRLPGGEGLRRYAEIARLLTGDTRAQPEEGVLWVADLCRALGIPGLRAFGLQEADVPLLAETSAGANSMKANPIRLSAEEMKEILRRSW